MMTLTTAPAALPSAVTRPLEQEASRHSSLLGTKPAGASGPWRQASPSALPVGQAQLPGLPLASEAATTMHTLSCGWAQQQQGIIG